MTSRDLYIVIRRAIYLMLDGFDLYFKVGKHKDEDGGKIATT
jgi:hypothetical protein